MALYTYSLKDFSQILDAGFTYSLPEDVLARISKISSTIGVAVSRPQTFNKKPAAASAGGGGGGGDRPKKKRQSDMEVKGDENWESLRTFQTTVIEENTGVAAQIDEIRLLLNKITDKTYDKFLPKILELLQNFGEASLKTVGNCIFEIASTNRFYSKLYANLFATLIETYSQMHEIFTENFSKLIAMFDTIEFVESSKDYDRFCANNKENEKRKALCAFFVNLSINGIIEPIKIYEIIQHLMRMMEEFITLENKKNEVDEIAENMEILYDASLFEIEEFIQKITAISEYKIKSYPSLTKKTQFKFMEILEREA
jgi:hypothetical protein